MPEFSILVVEDEPDLLELFAHALRRIPSQIVKAHGGQHALDILQTETPDLILLDVAMPDVDGIKVLRTIRKNSRLHNIKVVLLTAVPVLVDAQDAVLADMLLTKPIKLGELTSIIKTTLNM